MSLVTIPFGDDPRETALLLLGAAEALGLPQEIVRTDGEGGFLAPREVADDAGVEYQSKGGEQPPEEPPPAKKAAAKTAKKSSQ